MNKQTIKRYIARLLNFRIGEKGADEIWKQSESIGWNEIISIAEEHHVAAFLFYKIKFLGLEEKLKPEIHRYLSLKYQEGIARNVVIKHVLKEALFTLNQSGIKTILLKGAVNFCENIYNNRYVRSMEDLDILIKEVDFPVARQCMHAAGLRYRGGKIPHTLSEDFECKNVAVDMHYLPVPEKYINLFDIDSFWSKTMCVEMDGIKTHIPCPTDQIYHKFVHDVIRHQELIHFKIQALCDFMMISRFYKQMIDWEDILYRVRKNHIESLFKLYCWQLKSNFEVELPEAINCLSTDSNKYYEVWYEQLNQCPEWLESASERLISILVRSGNFIAYLKNSFNVLVKDSVMNESREFLLSLYHIKRGTLLLPFIRTLHLFRVICLHILIIAYLVMRRL